MKIIHSSSNLNGPVYQHFRTNFSSAENSRQKKLGLYSIFRHTFMFLLVESTPSSILHNETKVGFLKTHSQETHDVSMLEQPK